MTDVVSFWKTITIQLWGLIISNWILSISVLIIVLNWIISLVKGSTQDR